ncbi:hypothetical protein SEPCBS119000_003380 [Sporothrix epigloea]|uniref:Uncharacterized protein n=1 Tax=Sporothrix epigloea TaxID=1892477 RepID=A0ABP0DLA4_9PEZI
MQPLFAVHNHVSLLSVTIAPSTFLAALTLVFVFISLYLPRLPSLPRFFSFGPRSSNNKDSKNAALSGQQQHIDSKFVDDNSDSLDVWRWRNKEHRNNIDWRHRQLPPLPPPPFRPLLQERSYVEAEDFTKAETVAYDRKSGRRSDRQWSYRKEIRAAKETKELKDREKERKRAEKASQRPRLDRKIEKSLTASRDKRHIKTRTHVRNISFKDLPTSKQEAMPRVGSPLESWDASNPAFDPSNNRLVMPSPSPYREHSPHQTRLPHNQENEYQSPKQTPGLQPMHSSCLETDEEGTESINGSDFASGFNPPAWNRLENDDHSLGLWHKQANMLDSSAWASRSDPDSEQCRETGQQVLLPQSSVPSHVVSSRFRKPARGPWDYGHGKLSSRSSSPGYNSEEDAFVNEVLGSEADDDLKVREAGHALVNEALGIPLPGNWDSGRESTSKPKQDYAKELQSQASTSNQVKPTLTFSEDASRQNSGNHSQSNAHAKVNQRKLGKLRYLNVRNWVPLITRSWTITLLAAIVAILSAGAVRGIVHASASRPVPDLVKVAGVARSFAPLIQYSENAVVQVHDLEATGIAVWDLGESVRLSNLTSAPIIVQELDELSDSLRTAAMELTRFLANIDGDIDGILIVMEWAQREISQLQHPPASSSAAVPVMNLFNVVYDSFYSTLTYAGVLENAAGSPTTAALVVTALFGESGVQRTHATLHRTFNEFLGVLEEAVTSELHHSLALFALFESIDRQYVNLKRTVAREASKQDGLRADMLASLWTRILGPSAAATAKFEYNRELLRDLRDKTVHNMRALTEHNRRLLSLKTSLESLRRKLVSPLVRSVSSSTLTLEEQIRGLEDVGVYLAEVRSRQKGKLLEAR